MSHSLLLVADSTTLSGNARVALFVLIGVLLVILGFLIAFALVIRRSPEEDEQQEEEDVEDEFEFSVAAPLDEVQEELVMMASSVASSARASVTVAAVETSTAVSCPSCRREYDAALEFCPHDARRLLPTSQLLAGASEGGSVCPSCRHGFDSSVKFCPHDATALVPTALDRARRESARGENTGVVARICPECNERYDLAITFCTTDGAELVTLN